MRSGVQTNKLIDLTESEPEPETSDEWSMDALFAPTDEPGGADTDSELLEARRVVDQLLQRAQAVAEPT